MTSTRLLCLSTPPYPIQVPPPPVPASGARFYSAPGATIAQGDVIDVPGDMTGDAGFLVRNGPFVLLGQSGATAARPTYPLPGQQFVDTTLGLLLTYDGAAWRDVTGTSH